MRCLIAIVVSTLITQSSTATERRAVRAAKPHSNIRRAITGGLKIVQKAARNYPKHRQCYSCHHQTLPLLAMKEAKRAGFRVDEKLADDIIAFTRKSFRSRIENLKEGKRIGGRAMTVGYGLWTFWLADEKPDDVTAAMVTYLGKTQEQRGRWRPPSNRPPMEESKITVTLLSLYGMQKYGTDSQSETVKTAEAGARKWFKTFQPKSHEDRVMLLWTRHLMGASAKKIEAARKSVLAAQKPDGGWAQLDDMQSDAYATGQTLWVLLHTSSEFRSHQPARASVRLSEKPWEPGASARRLMHSERRQRAAIQKGIDFLLKTQKKDGSWFVKTRSRPVQIFFDNGDPHGKSQFISVPATAWATAALAARLASAR